VHGATNADVDHDRQHWEARRPHWHCWQYFFHHVLMAVRSIWDVGVYNIIFAIHREIIFGFGVCVLYCLHVINLWLVGIHRVQYTICSPVIAEHTRPATG
jgi:uncharacterized membrane protein